MRKTGKLSALFFAVLLILGTSVTAYAKDVPQVDKKGKISVTMRSGKKAIGGGTLTLYRVGEIREEDGNYSFEPTGDFAACGESFEKVTSATLAENLKKYALDQKRVGVTKDIGTDGKVVFENLDTGLYLLIQNKAAKGYNKVNPFLVTLPYLEENGLYNYEVDASPKVQLRTETEPTSPGTPGTPGTPGDSKLPQTGQLNWPVPFMAVTGLLLFAAGWMMCFDKRKNHEK